jgi:hypothetical protein
MKVVLFCASVLLMGGCATVKPWERGALARAEMSLEGSLGEGKALAKTFSAKEAAFGGGGVGAGGCGCN